MKLQFKLISLALIVLAGNMQAITLADAKSEIGAQALVAKQKGAQAYVAAQEKLATAVKVLKNNKKKSVTGVLSPIAVAIFVNAFKAYQASIAKNNLMNKLKPTFSSKIFSTATTILNKKINKKNLHAFAIDNFSKQMENLEVSID